MCVCACVCLACSLWCIEGQLLIGVQSGRWSERVPVCMIFLGLNLHKFSLPPAEKPPNSVHKRGEQKSEAKCCLATLWSLIASCAKTKIARRAPRRSAHLDQVGPQSLGANLHAGARSYRANAAYPSLLMGSLRFPLASHETGSSLLLSQVGLSLFGRAGESGKRAICGLRRPTSWGRKQIEQLAPNCCLACRRLPAEAHDEVLLSLAGWQRGETLPFRVGPAGGGKHKHEPEAKGQEAAEFVCMCVRVWRGWEDRGDKTNNWKR